ncbi:MAG TPA: type II secretion system protein [Burkholderiales bacterium]|nr:type II secretion system protein [Burkholderiales bacterium]
MRFVDLQARALRNGFSLVELVIVITITGVIAATVGIFILRPVQGYEAQVRRAELVDQGESALRRMQRDIRAALPNSVRIRTPGGNVGDASCPANNNVCVIEILHTVDGSRYRANPPGDQLQFNGTDTEFDVVGSMLNVAAVNPSTNWLVINNQTTVGADFNAYNCPAAGSSHNCVRMTATNTNLTATPPHIALANAFAPTLPLLASARQRFFVVDTPVTYLCDINAGALDRYDSYSINSDHTLRDQPGELAGAGATARRIADLVTSCRFSYTPGTNQRAGIVTLDLTITDPDVNGQAEQVRLLHQVHVYNAP